MSAKKIVYHCYGGAHSSVVAAAIHLGKLKLPRLPSAKELMRLSLFDRQTKDGHGQLHFFGFDEFGNQVYSVGCRNAGKSVENILNGVAGILGIQDDIIFIDTLHCVNMKMRIGGYMSRRLNLIHLGRPIVIKGTQDAFPELAELVRQTKGEMEH